MLKSLSIIIPAYNEENHLGDCLDSIAAQSEPPEEVIVVDNGSTDKTVAIARRYKFVKVVTAKEQGVVYARNAGFDAATCELLGRIDADVHLPKDWCKWIRRFYEDKAMEHYSITGGVHYYNLRAPRLAAFIQNQFVFRINRLLLGHYITFGSNMAMPRSVWQAVRYNVCLRTDIHEDLDLSIHLHQAGYQITYQATLITYAKMRRVFTDRQSLWNNLMWWPNTLKVHGNRNWVIAWLGALFLYTGAPLIPALERMSRWLGRPARE